MIKEIHYKNFKALRDTTLPLGRFTLIVGANGTGKSTALEALKWSQNLSPNNVDKVLSTGLDSDFETVVLKILWDKRNIFFHPNISDNLKKDFSMIFDADRSINKSSITFEVDGVYSESHPANDEVNEILEAFEIYSFAPEKISQTVSISSEKKIQQNGGNLAGILDLLKDTEPERWTELNKELVKWFPEFDQILFDRDDDGKYIVLRTKVGKYKIKAKDLSDGTLVALAYLTLAYLPNPPKIVAFEEPEKGIHPRLLENIQEAMYRLAYPENYGEDREPVQVIATTHSPYLLDLYKEHPEEIVISSKDEKGVHFERLIDKPHYEEVIQDAPLGDIWYSGILGGVPIQP